MSKSLRSTIRYAILIIGKGVTAHKVVSLREKISLPVSQVQGRLIYFRLFLLSI